MVNLKVITGESNAYVAIFFKDGSMKFIRAVRDDRFSAQVFDYPRIKLIEIAEFI